MKFISIQKRRYGIARVCWNWIVIFSDWDMVQWNVIYIMTMGLDRIKIYEMGFKLVVQITLYN